MTRKLKDICNTGDTSKEACGRRLAVAIAATGVSHTAVSLGSGKSLPSISNYIKGTQFPSREIMIYFYEHHRIDFNFFIAGLFSQLPKDVLEALETVEVA